MRKFVIHLETLRNCFGSTQNRLLCVMTVHCSNVKMVTLTFFLFSSNKEIKYSRADGTGFELIKLLM